MTNRTATPAMLATLALFTAAFEAAETLRAAHKAGCKEMQALVESKLGKLSNDASEAECDVYWDAQEDIEGALVDHPADSFGAVLDARVCVASLLIETVKANPLATAEHFEGLDAQNIGHGHWVLVQNYAASVARLAGLTA